MPSHWRRVPLSAHSEHSHLKGLNEKDSPRGFRFYQNAQVVGLQKLEQRRRREVDSKARLCKMLRAMFLLYRVGGALRARLASLGD